MFYFLFEIDDQLSSWIGVECAVSAHNVPLLCVRSSGVYGAMVERNPVSTYDGYFFIIPSFYGDGAPSS